MARVSISLVQRSARKRNVVQWRDVAAVFSFRDGAGGVSFEGSVDMQEGIRMVGKTVAMAFLAAVFLARPESQAWAGDLVTAKDTKEILSIARGFGLADIEYIENRPFIKGRIKGVKYSIIFFGCDDQGKNCTGLQFLAGWRLEQKSPNFPLSKINEWNRDKLFGKAYLDKNGDPVIEMNVDLDYGVSKENLEDWFDWWQTVITDFGDMVLAEKDK